MTITIIIWSYPFKIVIKVVKYRKVIAIDVDKQVVMLLLVRLDAFQGFLPVNLELIVTLDCLFKTFYIDIINMIKLLLLL